MCGLWLVLPSNITEENPIVVFSPRSVIVCNMTMSSMTQNEHPTPAPNDNFELCKNNMVLLFDGHDAFSAMSIILAACFHVPNLFREFSP
jgi:hypothetical protein